MLGFLPIAAQGQQSQWIVCASEGERCTFSGVKTVRYGASGSYVERSATDGADCSNAGFETDPLPGVWKSCEYARTAWIFCGYEGDRCEFSGSRLMRYGKDGVFVSRMVSGGAECSNAAFGEDPIPGVWKGCWLAEPTAAAGAQSRWTWCANESGRCEFTGARDVRFGGGDSYLQRSATGGASCSSAAFGQDPAPGVYKGCWYAASGMHPSKVAVYAGTDPAAIAQFEAWLGRQVDAVLGFTGHADWSDFNGSVHWAIEQWSPLDRPVLWSVPLIPNGATLEQAGSGAYNDRYRRAAEALAAFRPQDRQIHVRVGWEFNGDWFPWSAQGRPHAFVDAFRQFVTTFRSVSSRFVFEWNVNIGDTGMNPESAYPGDDVVDVIGMDFYWSAEPNLSDPLQAWSHMLGQPYGLQWHQDFAAAHGKPTAYSEWGVRSDNAAPYIQRASAWFERHGAALQTYWNSNADFPGQLSWHQYPRAGAEYLANFGVNQ